MGGGGRIGGGGQKLTLELRPNEDDLPNVPILVPHRPQTERLQIGDHWLSTSCEVVERPDHHCDDDLVKFIRRQQMRSIRPISHCNTQFELLIGRISSVYWDDINGFPVVMYLLSLPLHFTHNIHCGLNASTMLRRRMQIHSIHSPVFLFLNSHPSWGVHPPSCEFTHSCLACEVNPQMRN